MDRKYLDDYISDELWEETKAEIGRHGQQIGNDNIIFNNSIGGYFQKEQYIDLSIKRLSVINSTFTYCLFDKCAATGSEFKGTKFVDSEISDSNFQYVNFFNTEFISTKNDSINILGTNLCNSNFTNSVFKNIKIQASSFSQSVFSGAILHSCEIDACTMEGVSFDSAILEDMVLTSLNVEYADFTNAVFKNVYLPLMQLPYTFGGLVYYFNNEGLKLRSYRNQIYRDMEREEYRKLLFHLSVYFKKTQQYFPLANICLLNKDKAKFDEYIMLGIKIACINKNLRDLKHLVKLIKYSGWYNGNQLRSLYFNILDFSQLNMENLVYLHEFKSHFGEIYSLLGQQSENDIIVRFIIEEQPQLSEVSKFIEDMIAGINEQECDIVWKKVDMNKNSPVDVIVTFICNKPELFISCLTLIAACFFGTQQLREARKANRKRESQQNYDTHIHNVETNANIDNSVTNSTVNNTVTNIKNTASIANTTNVFNVNNVVINNVIICYQDNVFTNQNDMNKYLEQINNRLES